MLFALGRPLALLLMVAGFVVACLLQVAVRALVLRPGRSAAWAATGRVRRGSWAQSLQPRHALDVFGAVAALISGVGWARLPDPEPVSRARRGRFVTAMLAGCLACVVVGGGLVAAWAATTTGGTAGLSVEGVLGALLRRGADVTSDPGPVALLLLGAELCAVGLLGLLPLPPLPGGHVLLALVTPSPGWQKVRYYLVEQQIGVAVLVGLAILGAPQSVLVFLVDLLFRVLVVPAVGA